MRTLKLTLAYDGTRYVGWQRQKNGVSIQALVEDALAPLEPSGTAHVAGAGRTDAGVHAHGQVASWRTRSTLDAASLQRAANARLPEDVRVIEAVDVAVDFHARFSARRKRYDYLVLNAAVCPPLAGRVAWHVPQRLDLDAMRIALAPLAGRHDFRSFQAAGSRVTETVRTVFEATVGVVTPPDPPPVCDPLGLGTLPRPGRLLAFRLEGDGFLRHMVRNIVGTVVEAGLGRRPATEVGSLLQARDRRVAGVTAPPQGLTLVAVEYEAG